MEKVIIEKNFENKRIDKCLVDILKNMNIKIPSRSFLTKVMNDNIMVNGRTVKRSYRLKEGDVLEIEKENIEKILKDTDLSGKIIPEKGELNIVYENDEYIVLNKQKGFVVHPGAGNHSGTIANYIRRYLEDKGEYDPLVDRAGIVHRLDKGVSGLMIVAKSKESQEYLKNQFQNHLVTKIYSAETEKFKESELDTLTVVDGYSLENGFELNSNWFTVKGYIGRSRSNKLKMEFKPYEFEGSKSAVSHILKVGEEKFLVKIDTGRMHQIRATMLYMGRYIKGDDLYKPGNSENLPDSISLEAVYLEFKDMDGKQRIFNIYNK